VSHVFGITLLLLMPVSWDMSGGSSQFYALFAFFLTFLTIMLVHLSFLSYIIYKLEGFTLMVYFFIRVFSGSKFCPLLIHTISLRVLNFSIRNFTQLYIACKYYPSARYATAANLICSNTDIFRRPVRSCKQILP
jgi:hypothetical protein